MFRFMKIGGFSAAALSIQFIGGSLVASPLSFTQERAVEHALERNVLHQAAQTFVDQAEGRSLQAGRWENPEVKLEYASDRAFNDEGELGFGIGFEQTFPITNRLRLEKRIARDEIELARAEVAKASRLLKQRVASTFIQVAEIEAQMALRDELLELYSSFAEFVSSRVATGEASEVEVNQIQIERYTVEQERQGLANQHALELSKLRKLLGLDPKSMLKVQHVFLPPVSSPELPIVAPSLIEAQPAYRIKTLLCEIAEQQVSVAKAQRWADIAIEVFYEEERGVDAPSGLGRDRFFGIGVSVPLPLLNTQQGTIAERRARSDQFRFELQAAKLELENDASFRREQVLRLYTQAQAYDARLTQLVAKNLKDMQDAYASGQIALTELFRAQEQAFKVRSTHLSLLHDYEQAMIDWHALIAK